MSPVSRSARTSPAKRPSHAPQRVRIIAGKWRRLHLHVRDSQGLRPTPDRVRETLFNWLNHQFDTHWSTRRVLDLFAGSGALGFEAASRGASAVVMVDDAAAVVTELREAKERLGASDVAIRRADALSELRELARRSERFDLIFLDPPFNQGWIERLLAPAVELLVPGGLAYVESEKPLSATECEAFGLEVLREDKAGQVFYHLLRKTIPAGEEGR